MAAPGWRTNQSIQEARKVAKSLGKTAVIMVLIDEDSGTLELATYGTTGPRCTVAGRLGDKAFAAVERAWGRQ